MADSDASSSDSSPAAAPNVITEDDVRVLVPLGALNDPATLERMLTENRWLDVAEYLQKAVEFHAEDAAAAVAYPEDAPSPADMLRAHPELYVLPRVQHALELLGQGKQALAFQYYGDTVFAPTRVARRTPHLDALLARLQDMILDGRPDVLNLPDERLMTSRHIRDYLRVYFPAFNRSPEVVASIAASKRDLYTTAAFGEALGGDYFRCLVCHQQLTLPTAPDHRFVEHLHDDCPAVTPAVRRRLPRRNRPPRRQPAPAAAGEPHGGGAAGGGAPDHHQVAPD
ncbi:hypothetical protein ACP70R_028514 [Stipagrostis hirtigluma subsp. patula]